MDAIKKSRAEYWKDWYWNHGGREKVMSKRYINEYERTKKTKRMKSIKEKSNEYAREFVEPFELYYTKDEVRQFEAQHEDSFEAGANYVLESFESILPFIAKKGIIYGKIKETIEQLKK